MEEHPERARVGDQPPGTAEPEWEVFVREDEAAPLKHVGSVSAPSAAVAHEEATTLFGRHATDIWLCSAREVRRYSTHTLDEAADPASVETDGDERV